MNKRALKYLGIALLFIAGLTLGSKRETKEKTEIYPIDNVEKNFFMNLGHRGEVAVGKGFEVVFKTAGQTIKFLFGV